MIKRLIFAVLFLALVAGGIVGFNMFRDKMIAGFFAGNQPPPVTVSTIEAAAVVWQPVVEAIGTARAARGVSLSVEAGGVVEAILFSANERVEEGQVLVQIDDTIERADLAAAQASLELAQEELKRAETLQERGVSAATNVDIAQADATNARSQVVRLTAVMAQKSLVAPFAGVIGIPRIDVGQYVTPGDIYATLQDLDTMRVDFAVPEQQLRLVEIGLPVTVFTEVGTTTLNGEISGIEPRIDPNTRLVTVRAEVENPEAELNPGQFLRVRVELPKEPGVVAVPQSAVSSNLYGDSVYVVRPAEGAEAEALAVEQVFVETGRRSDDLVEIVRGVEPGDLVVTAGQNRLSSGARVTIDNTVSPVAASASG